MSAQSSATSAPQPWCLDGQHTCQEGPDKVQLRVTATKGPVKHSDGTMAGRPLSELRQRLGSQFVLRDPWYGRIFPVSLAQWANADSNATYITMEFAFKGGAIPKGGLTPQKP